jgi:tetratricopeptide (TPR) repeat protein
MPFPKLSDAAAGWLTEGRRPYLWIAALGLAVYFRTLFFGYAYFDDDRLILQNFGQLSSLKNILAAFRSDMDWQSPGVYYRPLVTLTFMADALWTGKGPLGYHLTNLALHLLASGLFFRLLQVLGFSRGASLFSGLLFVCHPGLAHAVAFIPGRYDTLLAVLSLGAAIAFLRRPAQPGALAVHGLLLAAALFTKETALMLPAVLLAGHLLLGDRPAPGRLGRAAAAWAAGLAGYFILRWPVTRWLSLQLNTPYENLAGLYSYLGKAVFPFNLSVMPVPADINPAWGMAALALLASAALLGGIRRRGHFLFGAAWFLLFLAPTAVRSLGFAYLLEQRLYLPLMGLLMMLMELGAFGKIFRRTWAWAPAAAVILLFSGLAVRHSSAFAGDLAFWGSAAATSPHSYLAHSILGQRLAAAGRWPEAERATAQAVSLNPADPRLWHDLGLVRYRLGKYAPAAAAFAQAVDRDSTGAAPGSFFQLARAQVKLGRWGQAESTLLRSLAREPGDGQASNLLSYVYFRTGDRQRSLFYYRQSVAAGLPYKPELEQNILRGKADVP